MSNHKTGLLEALENHGYGSPEFKEAMKRVEAKYKNHDKPFKGTAEHKKFMMMLKKKYPLKNRKTTENGTV